MLETKDYKHFRVGDIEFEGAANANRALPGDKVILENGIVQLIERAAHKNIVGTLELASKVRYGMTAKNHPIFLFSPFAESYPPFYVGSAHKDISTNVLAIIEFGHWTEGACPRGNLQQILGPAGDLAVEEEALALHASPLRWKKLDKLVEPAHLTHSATGTTFHVDPPGCKDIDDAITLNPQAQGTEVAIHIADVASWLVENPVLMEKAEEIGQTLYRDGVAIKPMFPAELSEGTFSLLPGQERRTVTLRFIWNRATRAIEDLHWSHENIRVAETFTYSSVTTSIFASELQEICSGIAGRLITDSHEWIEQLMLLYNREAAKVLRQKGQGVLRRHAGVDQARFDAYSAIGLPADRLAMSAGDYCAAVEPETRHWGLGQDVYCHATSPIRRWPDCVNQMILLGYTIESNPSRMNLRSKALKAYERDLTFVRALLGPSEFLKGTVAEAGRIWVPTWGRIVKADTGAFKPGDTLKITYFCDATKRNWKRRLVLKLEQAVPMDAPKNERRPL